MKKSVLVVDDACDIVFALKDYLEMQGYQVIPAYNGEEALEKASGEIDLILLDIMMNPMSGIEVLQILKEKNSVTPVIMITAKTDIETAVKCMKFEYVYDYISKPFFQLEQLDKKIQDVLKEHGYKMKIRKMEILLRENEERFNQVAESTCEWIWETDTDGLYSYANPVVEKILGYKPEEIVGKKHFFDLFTEEVRENLRKAVFEFFSKEKTFRKICYANIHKNGSVVFLETNGMPVLDEKGKLIGYRGSNIDITERNRADEALKRSAKTILDIIENAPFGIYLVNVKGKIEIANRAMIKIWGSSLEDFMKLNILDFPRYKELGCSERIKNCLTGKYFRVEAIEYPSSRKKREVCNIIGIPLEEDGEKKALIIVEDITEKKKVEEDLIRTQKLESVGILAGGIAHDFNNILNVILGNISLAKMFSEPGSKVFERLEKAEQTSSYAKDLTNQLLTFSKGGTPIRKLGTIAEIIKGTTPMVLSGTKIKSKLLLKDNLWFAEFDHGQIRQVINNLLLNATEAMPKGGTVTIKAENTVVKKGNAMALPEGNYVKFEIKDTGRGIPKEHH